MGEKTRNRKFRKKTFKGKELYVLILMVEPKEEYKTSKKCLKKYCICFEDEKEYYHIRSEERISEGMKNSYYNVVCIKRIDNFIEYIEDTISDAEKMELDIGISELLELEEVLNLVANMN